MNNAIKSQRMDAISKELEVATEAKLKEVGQRLVRSRNTVAPLSHSGNFGLTESTSGASTPYIIDNTEYLYIQFEMMAFFNVLNVQGGSARTNVKRHLSEIERSLKYAN